MNCLKMCVPASLYVLISLHSTCLLYLTFHHTSTSPLNVFAGTTIWSPLASGLLTGKYNDSIPEGSRLTAVGYGWLTQVLDKWHSEGKIEKVRALTTFAAEKFQCSMGQLALAWCVKNENVSTVLLGATKPEQLVENFGCLAVAERMTDEHMKQIDELLGNAPPAYSGFTGKGGSFRVIDTI